MNRIISVLIILVCLNQSCKQEDTIKGIPSVVNDEISQIKKSPPQTPRLEVWRYTYNNMITYYIPPKNADGFSDLYDEHGNLVCHPDGGFSGGGDSKCTDFFDKRTNGELIWKDNR